MPDWRYNFRPHDDSQADERKLGSWRGEDAPFIPGEGQRRWLALSIAVIIASAVVLWTRCL